MTNLLDVATQRETGENQYTREVFDNIQDHKAPTGTSKEAGLRRLRKDHELAMQIQAEVNPGETGGDRRSKGFKHDNVMVESAKQGTSKAYTLNRLKRGAPLGNAAKVRENKPDNVSFVSHGNSKEYLAARIARD